MKKQSYFNLINKYATERRHNERRLTDAPDNSFVEKRNQTRRVSPEMALEKNEFTRPSPVPLMALTPENFQFIELDKVISGSYYAKVENRNTGEMIHFGNLAIIGEAVMNRKIREKNDGTPLISENIPYHIKNRNIIAFNANTEHYKLFNKLFYSARNCSSKQCKDFELNNDVAHSEAIFVENKNSNLFKSAYYNRIVKLAKLRK